MRVIIIIIYACKYNVDKAVIINKNVDIDIKLELQLKEVK